MFSELPITLYAMFTADHAWSTEGVVTVSKSGDYTECQSTHLTSFAVLLVGTYVP